MTFAHAPECSKLYRMWRTEDGWKWHELSIIQCIVSIRPWHSHTTCISSFPEIDCRFNCAIHFVLSGYMCTRSTPPLSLSLSLSLSLTIRISFACYIKHPTSCPISFHWLYNPDLLVAGIGYGLRKRTYTVRLNASWFVMQTYLNFICDIWRRLDI